MDRKQQTDSGKRYQGPALAPPAAAPAVLHPIDAYREARAKTLKALEHLDAAGLGTKSEATVDGPGRLRLAFQYLGEAQTAVKELL